MVLTIFCVFFSFSLFLSLSLSIIPVPLLVLPYFRFIVLSRMVRCYGTQPPHIAHWHADTEKIYENILRDLLKSYNSPYPWPTRMKVMGTTEQRTCSILVNDLKLPCSVDEFLARFRRDQLLHLGRAPLMQGQIRTPPGVDVVVVVVVVVGPVLSCVLCATNSCFADCLHIFPLLVSVKIPFNIPSVTTTTTTT